MHTVDTQRGASQRRPASHSGQVSSRAGIARAPTALRLALGGLGLAGSALIAFATRWGPWAFSDGVGYIVLGRNLLLGRGLGLLRASGEFQPLSIHPPLYSLVLAGLGSPGIELEQAARWLNVALFGSTVILAGLAMHFSGNPWWLAAGAGWALLISPLLVYLYSGALSEPLFFVLVLISLIGLLRYLRTGSVPALVTAGVTAGLSVVTRYPGVAMALPGAAAVLLRRGVSRKDRLTHGTLLLGLMVMPSLIWLAWSGAQAGADPVRFWNWELTDLAGRARPVAEGLAFALWDWLPISGWVTGLSQAAKLGLLALSLAGAAGLTTLGLSRRRNLQPSGWLHGPTVQLLVLLGAFVVGYLGQLTFTYLFSLPVLDPSDIDRRILAPIQVSLLLFAFGVFGLLVSPTPRVRWFNVLPLAFVLLLTAGYLPETIDLARHLNQRGAGYTSLEWRSSETLAAAGRLPGTTPIITNESAAVLYWIDRPAYDFPAVADPERKDRFGDGNLSGERLFREDRAALVLFGSTAENRTDRDTSAIAAWPSTLTRGLQIAVSLEDGAIYFYPVQENSE